MNSNILLANGLLEAPVGDSDASVRDIGTILTNLSRYGFAPSGEVLERLMRLDRDALVAWWSELDPILASLTGADRKMGDHIVYKNFPRETLSMERGEWAIRQILIYLGLPYRAVAQSEKGRPPLGDVSRLKVLGLADETSLKRIRVDLLRKPTRWTDNETRWAGEQFGNGDFDFGQIGFKENGISLLAKAFFKVNPLPLTSGTDLLRLAAAMSDQDISLRQTVRFRGFKRDERRHLLRALEGCINLTADTALRPEQWKRLFEHLRPGDYRKKFPKVVAAYDDLYNRRTRSFNALIDPVTVDDSILPILAGRPGAFMRRFHYAYKHTGSAAVRAILPVLGQLSTKQLVGFRSYLLTINERKTLIYPPRANWSVAKIKENRKVAIAADDLHHLDAAIGGILRVRHGALLPNGISLDERTRHVALPTNDQKLAPYGRGTVFDIPENITFLRSASYWANQGLTWFDNGWNFFDANWKPVGHVGWTRQRFPGDGFFSHDQSGSDEVGAVMSGDPINIRQLEGRACQMIDLYPEVLRASGVRYALWNILSYSLVKFADAKEVLATLQMGENAETGNTYEPSRAQMVFPLLGKQFTSYVAYVDLEQRKLVYLDADLGGSIRDCGVNGDHLSATIPAYLEYLNSLPSVFDLVVDCDRPEQPGTIPFRYSDQGEALSGRAFVFQRENPNNQIDPLLIGDLLA